MIDIRLITRLSSLHWMHSLILSPSGFGHCGLDAGHSADHFHVECPNEHEAQSRNLCVDGNGILVRRPMPSEVIDTLIIVITTVLGYVL